MVDSGFDFSGLRSRGDQLVSDMIHEREVEKAVTNGDAAASPVALITYRCPTQGRQLTVGPADYEVYINDTGGDERGEVPCHDATVSVNCICGTSHRLNLFDSESL